MIANRLAEIGERLRAYRIGRGLAAEQVAERLGVSRAAVYRIEAGAVVKIETLDGLARVLETSVGSLLGQVIAQFAPLSYLLTSDNYARQLRQTLIEAAPSHIDVDARKAYAAEIDAIIAVLDERKQARKGRHLSVVNFVNMPEIERWLKLGLVGGFNLPQQELFERRLAARSEIEHLIKLIEREPMGVQIGLIEEPLPNMTFQLFRTSARTLLGLSPFRLGGELPNIRTGVAMLTGDEEPVHLYEQLVEDLWRRAHKGRDAAAQLRMILGRSAIKPAAARKVC